MKLKDCNINPGAVSMAPFVRNEPEESWVRASERQQIPQSLFDLYRRAGYSSFDAAPKFLKDSDNVLFSYFALTLRSLMLSLVEADEYLTEFIAANKEIYYPGRHIDEPDWTKEKSEAGSKLVNDAFRNLLLSLHASLDVLAELVAIFSQGEIKGLEVAYGQFSRIENWLKIDLPKAKTITTPTELYLQEIHTRLGSLVNSSQPETDWLPYMRLLRNKAAHLGHGFFRSIGLTARDGSFHTFIPRIWPYIWERDMKSSGMQPQVPINELLLGTLMHQDIIEYAEGATRKVRKVIDQALQVTGKAYTDFGGFEFNQKALDELNKNSKQLAFEYFLDPA